jgi:DNA adenine methylase
MRFEPILKWTGSKRYQSEDIVRQFPNKIKTYYEPFVGSASVLRQLIHSDVLVDKYICSDINPDLINLWNMVRDNPDELSYKYYQLSDTMLYELTWEKKRDYFNKVRERYNREHNPIDFLFLSRTAMNGLIRYNSKGEFNSAFHLTRNGIDPHNFMRLVFEWSDILRHSKVQFLCMDYKQITPNKGDFLYLDPPYANTSGMYYGGIDLNVFWDWLRQVPCDYTLSFDGVSGENDFTYNVPQDIYTEHLYIEAGCNTYSKMKKQEKLVRDSLYIRRLENESN